MKGIYLHGYQGFVTDEKMNYLQKLGNIYAPNIDYDKQPDIVYSLYEKFKNEEIDFVSGTSLGGILSFYLAILLDLPCFLLNPAVTVVEQVKQYIPEDIYGKFPKKDVMILIGLKDQIIDPKLQIEFFEHFKDESAKIMIVTNDKLEHFVPYKDFEENFNNFIKHIIKK